MNTINKIPNDLHSKLTPTFSAQQIATSKLIEQQTFAYEQVLKTTALQFFSENNVDQAIQKLKDFREEIAKSLISKNQEEILQQYNQSIDELQKNAVTYAGECDTKGITPDDPEFQEKYKLVLIKMGIILHECLFAQHLLTPQVPLEELPVHQKHKENLTASFSNQGEEFYDLDNKEFYKPSRNAENFAVLLSPFNRQTVLGAYVENRFLADYEARATWVHEHPAGFIRM